MGAIITSQRMNAFQFTNAFAPRKLVAIYAQQSNNLNFIDFQGIAAGIALEVYLLTIIICCLLVLLFTVIEHVRPENKFNCLDIATAILPCFNSQARRISEINASFVDQKYF